MLKAMQGTVEMDICCVKKLHYSAITIRYINFITRKLHKFNANNNIQHRSMG